MDAEYGAIARRLGIGSASLVAALLLAYAITLAAGFASLESGDEPIGDPHFTLLEVLILLMMPAMVLLMVAVHSWAPARRKALSRSAVIFMAITAAMLLSGLLALAELSGIIAGDIALRNIGIAGYAGVFFVVVLLLGMPFYRSMPAEAESLHPPDGATSPAANADP